MKAIVLTLFGCLVALATLAQEISPYQAYQIKENIKVEVLSIERVEKYGWDNLEVKYRVSNNSSYDLAKYDFMIHLVDGENKEIGSMEAFTFDIAKKSIIEGKYVQTMTPFANEDIQQFIAESQNISIRLEEEGQIVCIAESKISAK